VRQPRSSALRRLAPVVLLAMHGRAVGCRRPITSRGGPGHDRSRSVARRGRGPPAIEASSDLVTP